MPLEVIVLAAGQGTRMRSQRPKVLHELAGRPLIAHVLERARALGPGRITVVYGHGGDSVPAVVDDPSIRFVHQDEQLGTGHAVRLALPDCPDDTTLLVMYGDIPLIEAGTLSRLVDAAAGALAVLTVELDEPGAYGRILRSAGRVTGIVEAKDADAGELAIREVNTGFVAAPRGLLAGWIQRLGNDNAQREYYLTDIVAMAAADGVTVNAVRAADPGEVEGINTRAELARAERRWQQGIARRLMDAGVTVADPARLDVRGEVTAGEDCFLDVNVVLEGAVTLGRGVRVGPGCVIRDADIGDGAEILAMSVVEGARLAAGCHVGPFARVRPGTVLEAGARLGNFVEAKEARIGPGSKVNHLSYVGDCDIGRDVNVGAGVITCNYDGASKHRTVIGDEAFIGSDCQLVAPVEVGAGATVGAGTTLTRNAPADKLTVGRVPQRTVAGWRRPRRKDE